MTSWMSSTAWDQVHGGLYSNGEFLRYTDRANNPSMPSWCMLPILGYMGLNNDGRDRAVLPRKGIVRHLSCFNAQFHLSCDPFFPYSMQLVFPLQRTGEAARAGKRTERKASRQQSTTSEHDPQIGSRPARFPSITGLTFSCWILRVHKLRIHALGGVGAVYFRATAARDHKRKMGDCLPFLQSRLQGAHRRLEIA
jgi:hypothetical protein